MKLKRSRRSFKVVRKEVEEMMKLVDNQLVAVKKLKHFRNASDDTVLHEIAFLLAMEAVLVQQSIALFKLRLGDFIKGENVEKEEFQVSIFKPPGSLIVLIAESICSNKSFKGIVMPAISDMREEYFEALSQNRIWKARWVRVRGTWSFLAAMGLDRVFSVVSLCVKVWRSAN